MLWVPRRLGLARRPWAVCSEPHCRGLSHDVRHLPHHHDLAGATFNHTYFPIPHHGTRAVQRLSSGFHGLFQFHCINCHTTTAHQQTQTVNQHNGVKNFVYGPETCYSCHKNGGGG